MSPFVADSCINSIVMWGIGEMELDLEKVMKKRRDGFPSIPRGKKSKSDS